MDQFFPDWKVLDSTHRVTVDLSVQLGLGGHSDVYRGTMDAVKGQLPIAVAIKMHRYTLDEVSRSISIVLRIVNEISIWRSLKHPNIVPFYGLFLPDALFSSALPASVSLWCNGGTLLDYLRLAREGHTERPTDPAKNLNLLRTEVNLLREGTCGLAYLHGEGITHGDIKSANIFLHNGMALLGDFGYSVERSQHSVLSTSACLGTERFFAPESIEPHAHRTPEADIWALGCVIMEAHTLREPHSGMSGINMFLSLRKGDLPYSYYPDMNRYLWDLAGQCWSKYPDSRPSSRKIKMRLQGMWETLTSLYELSRSPNLEPTEYQDVAVRARMSIALLNAPTTPGETYSVPSTVVRFVACAVAARDAKLSADLMWGFLPLCELRSRLQGHAFGITSVTFLANGRLVSSSCDETLRIWDLDTGETVVGPVAGHTGTVSCVAVHGSRIASCSYDGTFRVWDADSGKLVLGPITAHNGKWLLGIAYSRDGTRIATAGYDNRATIWDANTGVQLREIVGHMNRVWCVAFSEDGTRLVSGSADRTIRICDVASGECIGEPLTGHTRPVAAVCFSRDDKRIFSSSYDGTIRIWDAETKALIGEPQRMDGLVLCMALSPDGKHFVSGSYSGKITMWDAHTGAAISTSFKDHRGDVYGVAFSPDGRMIVSAYSDKTIALWDATDEWKRWDIDEEEVEKDNDCSEFT